MLGGRVPTESSTGCRRARGTADVGQRGLRATGVPIESGLHRRRGRLHDEDVLLDRVVQVAREPRPLLLAGRAPDLPLVGRAQARCRGRPAGSEQRRGSIADSFDLTVPCPPGIEEHPGATNEHASNDVRGFARSRLKEDGEQDDQLAGGEPRQGVTARFNVFRLRQRDGGAGATEADGAEQTNHPGVGPAGPGRPGSDQVRPPHDSHEAEHAGGHRVPEEHDARVEDDRVAEGLHGVQSTPAPAHPHPSVEGTSRRRNG